MELHGIGSTVRLRWQRCAGTLRAFRSLPQAGPGHGGAPPSDNSSLQSSGVSTAPADTATATCSICV